jgi:hypothetical protein
MDRRLYGGVPVDPDGPRSTRAQEGETMRYMMFIKHTEDYRNQEVPAGLYEAMGAFVETNMKSGVLVDTAGLQPTSAGTRILLKRGKITTKDGPFTESKEVVGGYAIVEAKSREEALELAWQFMELHRVHWPQFEGECELRPLEVGAPPSER